MTTTKRKGSNFIALAASKRRLVDKMMVERLLNAYNVVTKPIDKK
jgi:hypothetical protein